MDGDLDEARLGELREVVSSAIGYSEARGDSLVVKGMKFSTSFADSLAEELRQERMTRIIVGVVIALVMLLLAAGAAAWWLRRRRARMAAVVLEEEGGKHVPTIQEMLTSPDLLAFQRELAVLEEQKQPRRSGQPRQRVALLRRLAEMLVKEPVHG